MAIPAGTLQTMQDQFQNQVKTDTQLNRIRKNIQNGGTFKDAEQYGMRSGQLLSKTLKTNITADLFNDGESLDVSNLASAIIPMMEQNYSYVSTATAAVQKAANIAGGLGMNPVKPEFDRSAAMNIVGRMANYDSFEDAEWMLEEPMVANSVATVDRALHDNADFQYRSGLKPKIIRTCEADACPWCQELEGEYDYEEVKERNSPVYQRHSNCMCEVTFEPGDGRVQDVHSKQWLNDEDASNRINKYKEIEKQWSPSQSQSRQQITQTGGSNRTEDDETTRRNNHAELYYEEIRNRKLYSDAKLIAQVAPEFSVEQIEEIRQHVFIREQPRDNRIARFDPSYDISQAWQRLTLHEDLWDSDLILLRHEYMELTIMRKTGCVYEVAHDQANLMYNWYEANKKDKMLRGKK